jgi:hypothetical protein
MSSSDALPGPEPEYDNWDFSDEDADWLLPIRRGFRHHWQQQVDTAISTGQITPSDAKDRWGHRAESTPDKGWEPLPETLYHVTTAADAVRQEGLKTRSELGEHVGLGGGPDRAISFTSRRETAEGIVSSMREASSVVRGDIPVQNLHNEAKEGGFWQPEMEQPDTPDGRMETYRAFAAHREAKTGKLDPLFWLPNVSGLAKLNHDQIQVMTATPVTGAHGWRANALDEWRVPTGKSVTVEDE